MKPSIFEGPIPNFISLTEGIGKKNAEREQEKL